MCVNTKKISDLHTAIFRVVFALNVFIAQFPFSETQTQTKKLFVLMFRQLITQPF